MTWLELSRLKAGDRVQFVQPWDIFPDALVPAGTLATITEQGLNEMQPVLFVRPDDTALQQALIPWEGLIFVYGPDTNEEERWNEDSPLESMA